IHITLRRVSYLVCLPFTEAQLDLRYPILLFFFIDPAPTEIYTLSLHDALPISGNWTKSGPVFTGTATVYGVGHASFTVSVPVNTDRKSTRLNSSHVAISYAVFCLKKKKKYILDSGYQAIDLVTTPSFSWPPGSL